VCDDHRQHTGDEEVWDNGEGFFGPVEPNLLVETIVFVAQFMSLSIVLSKFKKKPCE
jgi:hypothetical protein